MTRVTTIRIDNDFTTCQTGISLRTTDYKPSAWVDIIFCFFIRTHIECLKDRIDHVFSDIGINMTLNQGIIRFAMNDGLVLCTDNHGINPHGLIINVFYRHLRFTIGPQVSQRTFFTDSRQTARQGMRHLNGQRHEICRFVTSKTKHNALITGPDTVDFIIGKTAATHFMRLIDPPGDITGLLINAQQHRTGAPIESTRGFSNIANFFDRLADDGSDIDITTGGNFTAYQNQAGCYRCFSRHTGFWVFRQECIQDGIGDLIANLVRMPLGYGFRSKQVTGRGHATDSFLNQPRGSTPHIVVDSQPRLQTIPFIGKESPITGLAFLLSCLIFSLSEGRYNKW